MCFDKIISKVLFIQIHRKNSFLLARSSGLYPSVASFIMNKASNWQIVAQNKLFSDLYRQNYTRPAYLGSCGLFKLI